MSAGLLRVIIETLITNPVTVTLLLAGVFCIICTIVGNILINPTPPPIRGGARLVLGLFGVSLVLVAVGMAYALAKPDLGRVPTTPTSPPQAGGAAGGPIHSERQATGPEQNRVYNIDLAADEVIVGDAFSVENKNYNCVVFVVRGPGKKQFTVLDGAWDRYFGVTSEDEVDQLIQDRVSFLKSHWYCKSINFPVERIK